LQYPIALTPSNSNRRHLYDAEKFYVSYLPGKGIPDASRDAETPLLGLTGEAKVSETIVGPYQEGRVYFRGTWWPARCEQFVTLKPGDTVQVIDMSNITLLVEPFPCS